MRIDNPFKNVLDYRRERFKGCLHKVKCIKGLLRNWVTAKNKYLNTIQALAFFSTTGTAGLVLVSSLIHSY